MKEKSTLSNKFDLQLYEPYFEVDRHYTPEGRFYKTPFGYFPSVTTKLSKIFKKDLSAWIEKVGEKEANKISSQGKNRGTALHNICENYILGKPWNNGLMPVHLENFSKIKPIIDENVSTVYGVEYPLYSRDLETAGVADLLCKFNGHTTIVDFKTSRYPKKKSYILDYFVQAFTYAEMANSSLVDLHFTHVCIIIAVDGDKPQVFFEPITEDLLEKTKKMMRETKIEFNN